MTQRGENFSLSMITTHTSDASFYCILAKAALPRKNSKSSPRNTSSGPKSKEMCGLPKASLGCSRSLPDSTLRALKVKSTTLRKATKGIASVSSLMIGNTVKATSKKF